MSGMKVETKQRAVIGVRGIVQGVGFRPFVYRLAHRYRLNGWVRNTSGKVEIEVEGGESAIRNFLQALKTQAPSMARIEQIEANFTAPEGYTDFRIRESLTEKDTYQRARHRTGCRLPSVCLPSGASASVKRLGTQYLR